METKSIKDIRTTIEVDHCTSCNGTWFNKGELNVLEKISEPTLLEIRKILKNKEQKKILYCPSCENNIELHKAKHSKDRKVIIDYCPDCKGIWLDKGELEAIQKENWLITIGRIFSWLVKND